MGRSIAWRNRCPDEVATLLSQVSTSGLLVVQQPGPTSFVLKDTTTNRKHKVTVGELHQCNCRASQTELCLHILFVLSRVFRLPADNPLVWQRSLLAAEVDQLIRGHITMNQKRRGRGNSSAAGVEGGGRPVVPRRPIEEGDTCPICCDDIHDDRALVYCRQGCGNNIHAACFKQYATHNSTNPAPLLCPLCREPWGALGDGAAHNVQCSDCHGPVHGDRYKCAFCATYDLCAACFQCPMIHPQHPFNVCPAPSQPFVPATRPVAQRAVATAPQPAALSGALLQSSDVHPWMLRELGPEDYEALLQLDDGNAPTTQQATLLPEQAASLKKVLWTRRDPIMAACDACAICMENFREETEVNALPLCNHFFHVACAFRWLTECRAVCPIDNHPVPAAAFARRGPPAAAAASTTAERRTQQSTSSRIRPSTDGRPSATGANTALRARHHSDDARARHRFEDARAAERMARSRRDPNMTVTGYCPTQRDLDFLVVGSSSSSAAPSPAVPAAPMAAASGNIVPSMRTSSMPSRPRPPAALLPGLRGAAARR